MVNYNTTYSVQKARAEPRNLPLQVRLAESTDVLPCKAIADQHKSVLGFLPKVVFHEAMEKEKLLVAETKVLQIAGFVRFNHRVRGTETAIYDICVHNEMQQQGIGRALISALVCECIKVPRTSIILRCPEGIAANDFYQHIGFQQMGMESGKRRNLVIWRFSIETSLCSS
jgi:ribosomal protein S18 acetylase RimI-like enzyme